MRVVTEGTLQLDSRSRVIAEGWVVEHDLGEVLSPKRVYAYISGRARELGLIDSEWAGSVVVLGLRLDTLRTCAVCGVTDSLEGTREGPLLFKPDGSLVRLYVHEACLP